jgi:phosphoglycerate dehydrogenase-like enzyme
MSGVKRIAVLDDYERQALALADWLPVQARCEVDVFHRPLAPHEAAEVLAPYDAICLVRERMPVPAALLEQLPRLRFIAATGPWNRTLDVAAARQRGVFVSHTVTREASTHATAELAWGLALAVARHIASGDAALRAGTWASRVGLGLHGQRLGLIGLGRIGERMAAIGRAFGLEVVAWSQNLSPERAAAAGARWVSKQELLATSDVVSLHVVLSERTRGLLGREELRCMKPSCVLVNTARGPLVDEGALLEVLIERRIAGAGLDVFDREPLPADHPLTRLDNVVLTPHLGFSTQAIFRGYFEDTVENLLAWLEGEPIRQMPEVL